MYTQICLQFATSSSFLGKAFNIYFNFTFFFNIFIDLFSMKSSIDPVKRLANLFSIF